MVGATSSEGVSSNLLSFRSATLRGIEFELTLSVVPYQIRYAVPYYGRPM